MTVQFSFNPPVEDYAYYKEQCQLALEKNGEIPYLTTNPVLLQIWAFVRQFRDVDLFETSTGEIFFTGTYTSPEY